MVVNAVGNVHEKIIFVFLTTFHRLSLLLVTKTMKMQHYALTVLEYLGL